MRFLLPFLVLLFPAAGSLPALEKSRFNLADKPEKPRFTRTDISWPKNVGEAEICLWKDDRLAALSLGVDDNFPGDIPWWKEKSAQHDFKVTWFVITGRIAQDGRAPGGTWAQYAELEKLGHAVESHTVTHLHVLDPDWGTPEWNFATAEKVRTAGGAGREAVAAFNARVDEIPNDPAPDWITHGVAWEYTRSLADLDANLPGKKASALAFPGGKATKFNSRELAAKSFRVARAATGAPNRADMTDYLSTNAMSNWGFGDVPGQHPAADVHTILDPNLFRGVYYRGWLVLFAHGVQANPELFEKTFQFIDANRDKLWIGLYTDVAKYGQERDTATLRVESAGPEKIVFSLTDEMDDSYFHFPLTIKVRIPDAWSGISAVQGAQEVKADVVRHEGAAYALVQAVPDAGTVTLTDRKP